VLRDILNGERNDLRDISEAELAIEPIAAEGEGTAPAEPPPDGSLRATG
jgi:hypothetical protein